MKTVQRRGKDESVQTRDTGQRANGRQSNSKPLIPLIHGGTFIIWYACLHYQTKMADMANRVSLEQTVNLLLLVALEDRSSSDQLLISNVYYMYRGNLYFVQSSWSVRDSLLGLVQVNSKIIFKFGGNLKEMVLLFIYVRMSDEFDMVFLRLLEIFNNRKFLKALT